MQQYLINTTAIWLISLVMFDVFLRRESYHAFNRFYLLFTFLLGALLPLAHWQDNNLLFPTTIGKPLQQVITAKQNIVTATTPRTGTFNWQLWLTIIYLSGVFVTLCLLVIEIIKLSASYRSVNKSFRGGWHIIETGKEHAPFSFLNTLFVCSRQQYNDEEWGMIRRHEKRHTSLLHVADLMLMQLARIVFWFHPFVYMYNKRLLLVHEYQADNIAAQQPQVYGRFIIEQAILQSAPALSHSFNRSPIKKRILMLTRRSSVAAKSKMLVFIPVLMVCLLCFSKNIFSQKNSNHNGPTAYIGSKDNGFHIIVTYEQLFADPAIKTNDPECKITDYTLSFQPKGKDYYGPYKIEKSTKIPDKFIQRIKDWQNEKIDTVRIFIEDVHASYKGKDIIMSPVIARIVR